MFKSQIAAAALIAATITGMQPSGSTDLGGQTGSDGHRP